MLIILVMALAVYLGIGLTLAFAYGAHNLTIKEFFTFVFLWFMVIFKGGE